MRLFVRWIAAVGAVLLGLAMLPTTASAAALPAPNPIAPVSVVIDQPVFTWGEVEGAAYYEIEVALDDQFATLVDPPAGATPSVPPPIAIYGTTYIPTRSYQAKTMYWHVRAVGADTTKGDWSTTREFVRRWTNIDEPAGTDVSGIPASRVNNVRLVGGGSTPAINNVAITWDPVPGAAFYQLQVSESKAFPPDQLKTTDCVTSHNVVTPYVSGVYIRRTSRLSGCDILPSANPWIPASWIKADSRVLIRDSGVNVDDKVFVRIPSDAAERSAKVQAITEQGFIVNIEPPFGAELGELQWYRPSVQAEIGTPLYVRVRAVDTSPAIEYPFSQTGPTAINGMWSDHRRESGEDAPDPLEFTPGPPAGSGRVGVPVTPTIDDVISTDAPMLTWEPVPAADLYRFTLALDRDFTDIVGTYVTRNASFVPATTLDDNGVARRYYWYALPCQLTIEGEACPPDRDAINTDYVATFAKHSAPLTGLSAVPTDSGHQAILRWQDALTASGPGTPGGAIYYQVQISPTKNWAAATIITTDNLAYATTLSPAASGGTYYWRVRPLDGDGAGLAWSEVKDFTVTGPPVVTPTTEPTLKPEIPNPTPSANYDINPGAGGGTGNVVPTRPGKPAVTKVAKRTIRVRWNASTAFSDPVSGYLLFRSINGSDFALVTQTSARKVRMRAKPGVTYRFYVVANSAAGKSRASATRTFTMR